MTCRCPRTSAAGWRAALPKPVDLAANDVVALGPGLGRGPASPPWWPSSPKHEPAGARCRRPECPAGPYRTAARRAAPPVLTPHPGEFARLLGLDRPPSGPAQELAVRFAAEHGVVLVLKGHGTIVTDGRRFYVNTTGNPGMATGGSGDVLTGLIAALLGQGLDRSQAAQLGVYLHGLAGDLARDELGEVSLIASDLLQYLPLCVPDCPTLGRPPLKKLFQKRCLEPCISQGSRHLFETVPKFGTIATLRSKDRPSADEQQNKVANGCRRGCFLPVATSSLISFPLKQDWHA